VRAAFVFLDEDTIMRGFKPFAALMALACAVLPVTAMAADEVAALRAELQALRADYDARVAALESRLAELESEPVASPEPAPPTGRGAGASAFNPAISLILAGSYADTTRDPGDWRIAGFMPNDGEIGPGERSFGVGESELQLAASIDPYFSGTLIAAITGEDEIEVEEAYFRTLALPAGLTLKGGRFFSGIGYLNEVHGHAWDFADQPLAYQAFYANQYAQDGLQLKWLAPTDLFIEVGAEAGRDGAFPGTGRDRNGLGGTALFAHLGGDVGDSASWRVGASWNESDAEDRAYEDVDQSGSAVLNAFTGRSRTWIADAVFKWTPMGGPPGRHLKLQGEYLSRRERGTLAFDLDGAALADAYRSSQSGWYLQGVYQFRPRWRAGLRYDSLDSGMPSIGLVSGGVLPPEAFPALLPGDATRSTVMLDWSPSEFSRWRLQYAWDEARDDGDTDRQLRLQYLFGIGAHGAHKY
jgi:hypothetical protein